MRPYPLTVLNGGINRLRIKGGASAAQLYDLTNAYITNAGSINPREGTIRFATLDSTTIGLAAANGTFNIFSTNAGLSAPVIGTIIASTTGGSGGVLVSGTVYYYEMTAINALGETLPSAEVSIRATGANPSNVILFAAIPGATAYNLYRGTSPGGENKGDGWILGSSLFVDTGFTSPATPPVTNNTIPVVPPGFTLNVLSEPGNPTQPLEKIWFAKPFMGFEFVVAEFTDGKVVHFWLQNDGTWTTGMNYTTGSIILPLVPNGLAYQAISHFIHIPNWTPETVIASGSYVAPNSYNGFAYQAISVAGTPAHTGAIEPIWPVIASATVQEFGDFDASSSDSGGFNPYTTASPLSTTITDRYGDSATIANSGIYSTATGTLSTLVLASTKVKTWTAGTAYPPGSVVIPTTNQGAVVNAIPNGDFEAGNVDWTPVDTGGAAAWTIGEGRPYSGLWDAEIPGGTSMGPDGAHLIMTTGAAVSPGQSVTLTGYLDPNNNGADLELWLELIFYNAALTSVSRVLSAAYEGGGYRPASVTGVAPASATTVKAGIRAGAGTVSRNTGYADQLLWTLETPVAITNFLFEAVQPVSGNSAATEPAWPTTLGTTVIDGTVTWEAIGTSIITWQAIPMMQAGSTPPVFPLTLGLSVYDTSTFTNGNGFTTNTSISWQAVNRNVIDTGDPQTVAVTIGASHVFAGDNDIVDYSAAVNPLDWSSTNNAGYLPTGLNNYGDNPVSAIALYRGNLIVFNSGGYQMWQIDPDPQNMAFLDAQPVGCIWTRSCQSVANDLIFLTEIGVRNLGTIGATANMAIGNTGQPVDPLILAQIQAATYDPFTIYYPGRGQYMLIYGPQVFVLTINGLQGTKSWSRYIFPQVITDATLNSGSLFLRTTGNLVWELSATTLYDDTQILSTVGGANISFMSTAQWPYIDMGGLGLNKMLIGVDLVGDGGCILQIAYDQQDHSTFSDDPNFATSTGVTAPYYVQVDDTVPGEPLPIPISAPSYSMILTFPSYLTTAGTLNTWTWEAANFYLAPQGGGGVTG